MILHNGFFIFITNRVWVMHDQYYFSYTIERIHRSYPPTESRIKRWSSLFCGGKTYTNRRWLTESELGSYVWGPKSVAEQQQSEKFADPIHQRVFFTLCWLIAQLERLFRIWCNNYFVTIQFGNFTVVYTPFFSDKNDMFHSISWDWRRYKKS